MDPFEFFSADITDQIFSHLSGREVIAATEVSPHWEETIGASLVATKKIKIKISWQHDLTFSDDVTDIFLQSPRKYQHLELSHNLLSVGNIRRILSVQGRFWRSIDIKRISFQSSKELIEFLGLIASTVEELRLERAYIGFGVPDQITKNHLAFPKLKILRVQEWIFHEAFASCKTLKELYIDSRYSTSLAVVSDKRFLECNDLNVLEISSNLFDQIFSKDISTSIRFKLKTFIAKDLRKDSVKLETIRTNFLSFLKSQNESIETLRIDEWMGVAALKFIFHLPRLSELTIKGSSIAEDTLDWTNINLNCNQSIVKLHILDMDSTFSATRAFIDATPNLTELEIHSMDQSTMEYISEHVSSLTSLKLRTLDDAVNLSNRNLFLQLKNFSVDVIESNLEDRIEGIPNEDQSPLVKLLLNSSYEILH